MINYFLYASFIHLVFWLLYLLFLKNESHFNWMRMYLLSSIALSIVLPLLEINLNSFGVSYDLIQVSSSNLLDHYTFKPIKIASNSYTTSEVINVLLLSIFLSIICIKTGIFFYRLNKIWRLTKSNDLLIYRNIKLYTSKEIDGSFSFLNFIFLNEEMVNNTEEKEIILTHEHGHVTYLHSLDLIFCSIFQIVFWWLPTSYIIIKELKKIHEYQADAYALKRYDKQLYSSILISSLLSSNGLDLASPFHDNFTLKRLKTMNLKKSKMSTLKAISLMTMSLTTIVFFACDHSSEGITSEKSDINIKTATASLESTTDEVFTIVEDPASFIGGIDNLHSQLQEHLNYPEEAKNESITGNVYIQFTVTKSGKVDDVSVIKGIGHGCDDAALTAFNAVDHHWKPGKQRNQAINQRMVLPISFKL